MSMQQRCFFNMALTVFIDMSTLICISGARLTNIVVALCVSLSGFIYILLKNYTILEFFPDTFAFADEDNIRSC